MQLKIKPSQNNAFPIKGIFIKNESLAYCLKEIQSLNWKLNETELFPVPGMKANCLCGYLVIPAININVQQIGRHEAAQLLGTNLFIPEKSEIQPAITIAEIEKLLSASVHFFHPECGLAELTEKLDLNTVLLEPVFKSCKVTKPESTIFIPKEIISFSIEAASPDESIQNLEENIFPKKEEMKMNPLNLFEKGKLMFYKMLFSRTKKRESWNSKQTEEDVKKTGLWNTLNLMIKFLLDKENKWSEKLEDDFENLDRRNQKEMDKLMDLFKNDPLEALKYAIPLDQDGSTRGGSRSAFNLSKRWPDFSFYGNNQKSASGSVNIGDYYDQLKAQYFATARDLIQQKEYQKAAFIYMKLLKDYHLAAQTLEAGGYYQEAASVYLKYTNNKIKAAECYETGNMLTDAIEIYKELGQDEKVGDLYANLHRREEANSYFNKVAEGYKAKRQFVKASLIYKNKMNDRASGQSILLEGWRNNLDAYNCLNNYFANIEDLKKLKREIDSVYLNDVTPENRESFLRIMQHEYKRKNELSEFVKEIAYEIISAHLSINPAIVNELKVFNKHNTELTKDLVRFKINRTP